ncbi:hypothetical protein BH09PSE5_BH09PSE5_40960 [soil metagenome]
MVIVGSALDQHIDVDALVQLSEAYGIPVAASWKQQHLFPNSHPHYAGHLGYNISPKHLTVIEPADLVLGIGTRLGDVTTQGYRFPMAPQPTQPLVHIYPAREALRQVYPGSVAIQADSGAFMRALSAIAPREPASSPEWIASVNGYASELMRWVDKPAPDGVVFGAVMVALESIVPDDAIFTQDAGNFSGWMHRYFHLNGRHTLLGAIAGAMGFGVPAAVAASLRHPERKVICLVGDGGMLMTGNELATAVQFGAKPVVILSNNNCYATIRQHQEKHFPGRVKATTLHNPDFVALGKAFGVKSLLIDTPEKIEPVLREALAHDGPVLVEVATALSRISAFA